MRPLADRLVTALERHLAGKVKMRVPEGGLLVWTWFCDLSAARSWHAAGPNPIAYSEIVAYGRATGWPIEGRHVAMIRALDDAFIGHLMKARPAGKDGVKTLAPVATRPMTPALFDTLFG